MTPVDFYFDPVSPYAYLAFERLPQALQGCSYAVRYRPVLLAAMLKHWGQKGPVEIGPKREWTYRHIAWIARRDGVVLQRPPVHPFNPLALLRLLVACAAPGGLPNRAAVEAVLRHVWQGGADPHDPQRLQALARALPLVQDPQGEAVKQALRTATDEAITLGVFGVPTMAVGGRLFWGGDSLEMVAACLLGDPRLER